MKATDEQIERVRSLLGEAFLHPSEKEALAAVLAELNDLRKEVARLDHVDDLNRELIAAQTEQDNQYIAMRGENAKLKRLEESVIAERRQCKAEKAEMLKRENFDISAMSARIQAAEDRVDAAIADLGAK